MRDGIELVKSQPIQRLSIISDLYILLLDGFDVDTSFPLNVVFTYLKLEVLFNCGSELLVCMMHDGLLHVIGDIIVSETDPSVLICSINYAFF